MKALALGVVIGVAAFCLIIGGPKRAHAAEFPQAQATTTAPGLLAWSSQDKAGATSPVWRTHRGAPITVSLLVRPCEKGERFSVTLRQQARWWPHPPHTVKSKAIGCKRSFQTVKFGVQKPGRYFAETWVDRADIARTREWSGLAFFDGRRPA